MSAVSAITLSAGDVEVVLDPSRGGEITRIGRRGGENALAHEEWVSPLPASGTHRYRTDEENWLGGYRGGWQFLFPNAGAASVVDGVEVGFHGEASSAPAIVVEKSSDRCVLRTGARLPLELTRTVQVDASGVLRVEELVRNDGTSDCSFLWGHHPVFPLRDETVIDAPPVPVEVEPSKTGGRSIHRGQWPILQDEQGDEVDARRAPAEGSERLLYLTDVAEAWVAVRHPGTSIPGVAVAWSREAFPHLWIWSQRGGDGFPFFGRARMLGLEPQRAWPFDGLAGAVSRGQALTLAPGEVAESWLTLRLLDDGTAVSGVDREGRVRRD